MEFRVYSSNLNYNLQYNSGRSYDYDAFTASVPCLPLLHEITMLVLLDRKGLLAWLDETLWSIYSYDIFHYNFRSQAAVKQRFLPTLSLCISILLVVGTIRKLYLRCWMCRMLCWCCEPSLFANQYKVQLLVLLVQALLGVVKVLIGIYFVLVTASVTATARSTHNCVNAVMWKCEERRTS